MMVLGILDGYCSPTDLPEKNGYIRLFRSLQDSLELRTIPLSAMNCWEQTEKIPTQSRPNALRNTIKASLRLLCRRSLPTYWGEYLKQKSLSNSEIVQLAQQTPPFIHELCKIYCYFLSNFSSSMNPRVILYTGMLSRYLVKTAKSPPICLVILHKNGENWTFGFLFSQTAACLLAKYTKNAIPNP